MNFKLGIKTLSLGLKMAFMREKDAYGGKCKCLRDYFQVKCDIYLSAMIMEYVCNSGHSDSGDILARTSFSKYREPA